MPPKKSVTREDILTGAMALFRERGMEELGVRELARYLGCSTQPIYLSFSGLDALCEALVGRMWEIYISFIKHDGEDASVPPYKRMGLGYIRFAREESAIFRYLFMRPVTPQDPLADASFTDAVAVVERQLGLSHADAERFHVEQWLFIHGIASMLASGYLALDDAAISAMMTDVYLGLKARFCKEDE